MGGGQSNTLSMGLMVTGAGMERGPTRWEALGLRERQQGLELLLWASETGGADVLLGAIAQTPSLLADLVQSSSPSSVVPSFTAAVPFVRGLPGKGRGRVS